MKTSRKIVTLLLIATLAYNFFVTQASSQEKKVLRMAVKIGDIRSMDPHFGVTISDIVSIDAMYNALLRFPAGQVTFDMKKVQGDLAEKWKVSKDGLVWTFYLRKGVKFHKGYGELTSEDVKFSFERAADAKTCAFHTLYKVIDKVEALDKYTVRLSLKENIPSIMEIVSNFHAGFIVSKKAVLEKGDNFKIDPIGTGPFMLESYTPREKVVFVRNPDYFEGKTLLDGFELWLMPDAATREMAFEAGKVDMIDGIQEQAWVNKIKGIPNTVIDIIGPGEANYLFFNITQKPFDDIRVRKAIIYGVNREELIDFLGRSLAVPMISPVPTGFWGYTDKVPIYPFDPSKAKKLLKDSGYPEGLKLEMVMTEQSDFRRPMEQLQEQLRRIGVDVKLNIVGHSTFHSRVKSDSNIPMMNYHSFGLPIASTILARYWHSRTIIGKPTQDLNISHYDKVDKEIEIAIKEVNPKKQLAYWAEAQRKIMEDAAVMPLAIVKFPFARKNYVKLGYELKDSLTTCPNVRWNTDIVK